MFPRFAFILLLLFPLVVFSQDLQDQLFIHNAKQMGQTKQIPNIAMISEMEKTIDQASSSKVTCEECQIGMSYALSRLFWLSGNKKKAKSYLKKVGEYFDKTLTADFNQTVSVALMEQSVTYADQQILKQLNLQINGGKGKKAVFFLTGYGLVHQYYLSLFTKDNPVFEHHLVEGASSYEILPLLFELYGQSLTAHEQVIHDQLHELAGHLEEAFIAHEQSELEGAATGVSSFNGKCEHIADYRKLLTSVIAKI